MIATKLLKQQHREVEAIFKKLGSERTQKAPLLKELSDALSAHMAIEQEIFYPAIASIDPDLVHESFEEHALAEIALKRLLETEPDDESFQARVTATQELIEHHVEEEEEDLFPKVEKKMERARLKELGEQMEARFEQAREAGFKANVPAGFAKTSSDVALGKGMATPGNGIEHAQAKNGRARARA